MFYVYIIESEKNGNYYVGHSDEPNRRLKEHNESTHLTFTSKFRPWKLVAQIAISESRGYPTQTDPPIPRQIDPLKLSVPFERLFAVSLFTNLHF